ncbi:hypothetical protein BDV24DRAFT_145569 [Aspergillus arachidicola]|uniref:Uncharacterized protein n=1 Tax=Aspergillus arachidicola TaxID=656916 RepID=A0A5N6XSU4_9EURO|nr:hypothetical protein BDV24DRAFT_145569 [Aspergillus arachidicola]
MYEGTGDSDDPHGLYSTYIHTIPLDGMIECMHACMYVLYVYVLYCSPDLKGTQGPSDPPYSHI